MFFVKKIAVTAATFACVLWSLLGVAPPVAAQVQTAVEYGTWCPACWDYGDYYSYFVTSFPDEIAALDGGAIGGDWHRTGETFKVWTGPASGALPSCRFLSTTNFVSHFFTPYAAECQDLQTNPAVSAVWLLETPAAFYLAPTNANGNCSAAGTVPLYRAVDTFWGAPNHRYTTDPAIQAYMISAGWVAEGNGPNVIFACVPQ